MAAAYRAYRALSPVGLDTNYFKVARSEIEGVATHSPFCSRIFNSIIQIFKGLKIQTLVTINAQFNDVTDVINELKRK